MGGNIYSSQSQTPDSGNIMEHLGHTCSDSSKKVPSPRATNVDSSIQSTPSSNPGGDVLLSEL